MHLLASLGAIGLSVILLSGCAAPPSQPSAATPVPAQTTTEKGPASTPTPTVAASALARQARYEQIVAAFPLPLPEGYSFPETTPVGSPRGGPSRDDAARLWWGCSVINAAWEHAAKHDYAAADSLIARLEMDATERWVWDIVGHGGSNWIPDYRYMGDNWGCAVWLNKNGVALDFPPA